MKSKELAEIVLTYFDVKGDLISNKKLQKIVYYIEAWSLVYFSSIVNEDFEAWVHGPVIHSLYNDYKQYGSSPIVTTYAQGETPEKRQASLFENSSISKKHQKLVVEVLNKYGTLTSYQLEALSHSEDPWKVARKGYKAYEACSVAIDKKLMKTYYKSRVEK